MSTQVSRRSARKMVHKVLRGRESTNEGRLIAESLLREYVMGSTDKGPDYKLAQKVLGQLEHERFTK